jgi:pyruvate/2-oxoglutarate dehydrogenase complex dihydrolipoamide acyltransferase (E2) component
MITDVVMPKLGVEMTAARVIAWHRAPGDRIEQGDVVVTIETEKVNFDVTAPASGLVCPVAQVDEELPVGGLLGRIAGTRDEYRSLAAPGTSGAPARAVPATREPATREPVTAAGPPGAAPQGPIRATPLARKLARLHGVDLETVRGSGVRGQIREADVRRAIEAAPAKAATPVAAHPAPGRAVHRRVPFKGMRQVIARRLHEGLQATAQMTDLGELDVSELVRCREQLKAEPALVGGTITYTDFFIKIAALVLRELRQFNASLERDEIVEWGDVNVGFATSVEGGLVVPVIRAADRKPLTEIRAERARLVERATAGALRLEDVSDGTFTVTNFGSYGSWMGTPLINPPQVAILGVGEIRQKPAVCDGQVVPRWLMGYALTIDHRVLDGADAGRFLRRFRELCERPWVLLIGEAP